MKKGETWLAKKDYKRAIIEFKVAAQNMPKDVEPVYRLGMAYLEIGAMPLAWQTFQKAIELSPGHQGAQYQLALFKVGSDKPGYIEEARKVITSYLATHPSDAEALGALALAEAKSARKDEAIRLLETALEKNPTNARPASVMIAYFAAKGDTETATEISRRLTAKLPNSPEMAALRAEVSLATNDAADADAEISRALSIRRDFRPALQLRLRREIMAGNPQGAEQTTQELSKLPEKQTWSAYARMLFAEKKIDAGIAEFERVLHEHPDDPDLRNQYSGLLLTAGRQKEAKAVLAATLAKFPKDKAGLLQRVSLQIDEADLDGASRDVKALQEMKASSAPLSYQQARIFALRGDTTRQGDMLAEALKYDPAFFAARRDLVQLLLAAGNPKAALEQLEQAKPADKASPEYAYLYNMALIASGDYAGARKGVDAALAKVRSAGFLYQDALLRINAKDLAGARTALEASFQAMPANPPVLGLLGEMLKQQGQSARYLAMLRDASAKNPGAPELHNALGVVLASQGDVAGARAAFEKARAAGDVVNASLEIAALDLQAGAAASARQRLSELVKTRDSAKAQILLAQIAASTGASSETVVQHYLRSLQLEPANVLAMNNLADTLAQRPDKLEDALFWAQKAATLAPENAAVADTLGWIYYRQGKYDAAVPFLEKSARTKDRAIAHYHLAAALAGAGDRGRARSEFEVALKQDPKSPARALVSPSIYGK